MSMIKNISEIVVTNYFIFFDNKVLIKKESLSAEGSIIFPDLSLFKKCIDFQIAHDWFAEPEQDYAALTLEDNSSLPKGYEWIPIREVFAHNTPAGHKASRALSLLN